MKFDYGRRVFLGIATTLTATALALTAGATQTVVNAQGPPPYVITPSTQTTNFFQTAADRQRAVTETARLKEIQDRNLPSIRALPGVNGMGIGLDRDAGRLIFFVSVNANAPQPALPGVIEGVPVRVLRVGAPFPLNGGGTVTSPSHGNTLPLPVEMGNSGLTGTFIPLPGGLFGAPLGSLGFKACDVPRQKVVYVTAAHCSKGTATACAGTAGVGAPTYHPSPGDVTPLGNLGTVIGATATEAAPLCGISNLVDAASVDSTASQTQLSIRDIGVPSAYAGSVVIGDLVQKSGRTTGQTFGVVIGTGMAVLGITASSYCCGAVDFADLILVAPVPPSGSTFVLGGDSGSALVDMAATPAVVGLNFLGVTSGGLDLGYASPVSAVLAALDLSMNQLDCLDTCAAMLSAQNTRSAKPMVPIRAALDYRDRVLAQTERGREYIRVYYEHTAEVVKILLTHPSLLAESTRLFDNVVPALDAATAGRDATISQEDFRAIDAMVEKVAGFTSKAELRKSLNLFRMDMRNPDVWRALGIGVAP